MVVTDTRACANSDRRPRRVPGRGTFACLLAGLLLGACAPGAGYRSLHEVPQAPVLAPAEERLELGDALLEDRAAVRREGQALRHETGLGPAPADAGPAPSMPRPAQEVRRSRPENVEAAYVEERVRAETSDVTLGDFLRRLEELPETPAAAPGVNGPATADAPPPAPPGGKRQAGRDTPPPAPLLDRLLARLGLATPETGAPE
ncbi:hypothetical protein [Marinimicrococcus flavescens]|uniref:DUF3035 domain-containing protein n=1 Tax=Marinimicrococcus flavescens TaxID=3031815 RepID=A0AAP3XPJ6_9PROT|nr:hypothetical protein [Marinimicrococcus flavescens]